MKDTVYPNTLGQFRVRTDFNVVEKDEKREYVNSIKKDSAALIDNINQAAMDPSFNEDQVKEFIRLKELAMTAVEQAAMWAVKMATIQ